MGGMKSTLRRRLPTRCTESVDGGTDIREINEFKELREGGPKPTKTQQNPAEPTRTHQNSPEPSGPHASTLPNLPNLPNLLNLPNWGRAQVKAIQSIA